MTISNAKITDSGTYICLVSVYDEDDMMQSSFDENLNSNEDSETVENEREFAEALTIILKIRTVPGPVSHLHVRISTILCVLMWEFPKNNTSGYPLKSFTAEFRKFVDTTGNDTEYAWKRLDPRNIPSNVVSLI